MEKLDERILKIIQKRFGYNDNELEQFKNDTRNIELISRSKDYDKKYIVLKVVESKGCNSNHKVGDKFYFDYAGNILTELCPKRICGYALNNALMLVFTANEMIYAGIDPNEIRFKRSNCFDVGIECGGWGRIVLELSVEDKP
ncbi:MAG: TIGR04076 family protein [Prolixibacteraceae bacterium]|nr:TIGR04076 family protein [Prolixibacteraceae bacterium]